MPVDLKMDYIEFAASDMAAVKSFYSAVFDWEFTDYGPNYQAFTDGKMDGGFYLAEGQSRTENGAALLVFYAADLEALQQAVLDSGGSIAKDVFSFPGGRRFHFYDPVGNELAVWSDN